MKIFAITHAEKEAGTNPSLTRKGRQGINDLLDKLDIGRITNVIIGTGKRFNDVFLELNRVRELKIGPGKFTSPSFSPLLGSADSGTKSETGWDVVLADGTKVGIGNYIGLIGTVGIDLWAWLGSLGHDTLLCTGREFIGALVPNAEACQIYVIDTDTKTVIKME